jgi:hypothetical protein
MQEGCEITIGGAPVVLAVGYLSKDHKVWCYVVVTQERETGDCRIGTVLRLVDADELEDTGKVIAGEGYPARARLRAISHALELVGYPGLAEESWEA